MLEELTTDTCTFHIYILKHILLIISWTCNNTSEKLVGQLLSASLQLVKYVYRFLNRQSTERLIHALVTSHVDYCNSLYSGLPNSTLAPLQHVQNTAARLVTKSRKHEHITPILNSLPWLPVVNRIKFKILLLVFKIKHGFARLI